MNRSLPAPAPIDPRQLSLIDTGPAHVVDPSKLEFNGAIELAEQLNAWRDKSRHTYRQRFRQYGAWCQLVKAPPFPITPAQLVDHLSWLWMQRASPASIRLACSALAALELATRGYSAGIEHRALSIAGHPVVRLFLAKLTKQAKDMPQREARAITLTEVERMLQCLGDEGHVRPQYRRARVPRWVRDRAILLIGIAGALRRSELAALHLEDVQLVKDGDDDGMIVHVRRGTKCRPRAIGILRQDQARSCPVDAVERWIAIRGKDPGPLFLAISHDGYVLDQPLRNVAIGRMIQRVADRAGVTGDISSHTLRRTFATWCGRLEKSHEAVMAHGGWKDPVVMGRYVERGKIFDTDNPTRGLFDRQRHRGRRT